MTTALEVIIAAVISGPVMWFLHRFDRRNTRQHEANSQTLATIDRKLDHHDGKLDRLDDKISRHIDNPKGHR